MFKEKNSRLSRCSKNSLRLVRLGGFFLHPIIGKFIEAGTNFTVKDYAI